MRSGRAILTSPREIDTIRIRIGTAFLALLCTSIAPDAAEMPRIEWALDDAIRQIDGQAGDFESAMARVDVVVRDEAGDVREARAGNAFIRENGDLRISPDGEDRMILLDGGTLYEWDRASNVVTSWSVSGGTERLEPFYRLGFSVSGRDMDDHYLVTILGEEEMDDARTLLLELTPEREREREVVSRIRLWIDQASWMPRRQEFSVTADRSVHTVDYTDMARNLRLNPDLFDHAWPRNAVRDRR